MDNPAAVIRAFLAEWGAEPDAATVALWTAALADVPDLVQTLARILAQGFTERPTVWYVRSMAADKRQTMRDLAKARCPPGFILADMIGPGRVRVLAWPRQDAMAAMAAAGYSLTQIGNYFGGRDHTTVIHGIRRSMARKQAREA